MLHPKPVIAFILICVVFLTSCYTKDIEFAGEPSDGYTGVISIDSVEPKLSTVILDSFVTSSTSTFLLGQYADPFLGKVSAKPFFQVSMPTTLPDIPDGTVYDSLVFVLKLNKYYYGDTTVSQQIVVSELSEGISYSYNNQLYNTSSVGVKPTPLGTRQVKIYPSINDSIAIRLDDAKGLDLFTKLKAKSPEVSSIDNFLQYFKGLNVSFGSTDNSGIYGITDSSGTVGMRLYYHTNFPLPVSQYANFPRLTNDLAFTHIFADRSAGGFLLPAYSGKVQEVPAEQTGNMAFTQSGTGVLMKVTFPTLRNILQRDNIAGLLNAQLYIRPVAQTFKTYLLPPRLYMGTTDGSNTIGSQVMDSSGSAPVYAEPVIDFTYGINTYYRYNLTSYISQLLNTGGISDHGFFVLQEHPSGATEVSRGVFGNAYFSTTTNRSQLVLQLLTIKK